MDNLEEMDKKYSPARLTQEEIENVNTPIKVMKLKLGLKIFQQTKVQTSWHHRKILSTFREELISILLKLFQKNCRGKNTSKLTLQDHHHPDTRTRQRYHKKEKYRPMSLMDIDTKILSKILPNQIQQHIRQIIHHDQVGFIPKKGDVLQCMQINQCDIPY